MSPFIQPEFGGIGGPATAAAPSSTGRKGTLEAPLSSPLVKRLVRGVLVGAPEAQTQVAGVDNGGAVFKCPVVPLSSPGACEEVPFDPQGNSPVTDKSNQWFGATVESSGPNGKILACAPRLVWFRDPSLADQEREPTGTCFVGYSNFTNFVEYSPCQTTDRALYGFDKITHCEAGFSAQIVPDNSVLVMGAPGSFYLQGQIYSQDLTSQQPATSTSEGAARTDNSYRGFSLALGDFNGDGVDDYVVGTPRGDSLMGLVEIFDQSLALITSVRGGQLVSYFGNSVEAEDVNGDGLDDLLVGAPMHTDKRSTSEKWEAGQVYVYLQQNDNSFSEPQVITGKAIRARFGYSISSIGDSNQDGFNDVAVGAPYDGEGQTGKVYIFHGSANGLQTEPSQTISPSSLGQTGITTFGFSVQGGQDMDKNNYPDLLIGAESSDRAILVRARPVVLLHAELTLDPIGINLENRTYELSDGTMVTSFVAMACFRFTGNHLPDTIAIMYTLTLDSRTASSARALLVENDMSQAEKKRTLNKDQQVCDTWRAYVVNTIQDKLTPIEVTINYELDQDESSLQAHEILPIMDAEAVSTKKKQVYIQNNCADNICVPELGVSAVASTESIIIGGMEDLTLDVTLENSGEDAFQSTLMVYYPPGLQFVRLERNVQNDLSINCAEDSDRRVITCDTGNPLAGHRTLQFGLTLSTVGIGGNNQHIEFYFVADSENKEGADTLRNNEFNMTVEVTLDINLKLLSASNPEILTFPQNPDNYIGPLPETGVSESDIGPGIVHLYEVRNGGPSSAGRTTMEILWPMKDEAGEYLFYLLGVNAAEGVTCDIVQGEANPLGVKLDASTQDELSSTSSRRRRDAAQAQALTQSEPYYCQAEHCVRIRCDVTGLGPGEGKVVRLLGRFWQRTFQTTEIQNAVSPVFVVASTAVAEVMEVPYNIPIREEFSDSTKATTTLRSEDLVPEPAPIAWWIIVVSVLGGIILLIIIILALWKCGFFERKKPGEEQGKPYTPVATEEKSGEPV
ncbi:integrin alpha-8-like [Diadema antillarum]|uniref:integrin alpha-8-like n=1 Tax=Diadema antillarum TaxID=105358 RepID=UPI003A8444B6